MGFELRVDMLSELSFELPVDGRAHAIVNALLRHLTDVVHIGLLLSVAFLSLFYKVFMYSPHHLAIP